ncbi:MAG: SLC13/DASS family transporter [Planctomycetes bacterium]|nr:SLC13/DASS family transporter [Planctomycetota bacterium]
MPSPDVNEFQGSISEAEARFERFRRSAGFFFGPSAFLLVYALAPSQLSPQGVRMSAILAGVLVLWMTESLPLPVTGLLGTCLCILLGVAEAKAVLASFADPIIFLMIGSFILARAMTLHHLDRRFALAILSLRWVGGRPGRLLAAFGIVTATLSLWVSNTATTAMMMPIALGILDAMRHLRNSDGSSSPAAQGPSAWPFATGFMLMVAYAASVGGLGTPVGSPPNLIGIALIQKNTDTTITFVRWSALCLPLVACMYLVLFLLLYRLHPPGPQDGVKPQELAAYLQRQRDLLGPWTRGQIHVLLAFGVAVVLWVAPGVLAAILGDKHPQVLLLTARVPEGPVAILASCLLFLLPTDFRKGQFALSWQEASRIDWGTILMFAAGLTFGNLIFTTGVADLIGREVTRLTGTQSLWGLTALAIGMSIVLSEATSNMATANMVIPVVIAVAKSAGVNPLPPALGACIGASYGFMLPVSTAPNAIVYGSGLVPISRMIRAGLLFDACGFVVIFVGLRLLCPVFGYT